MISHVKRITLLSRNRTSDLMITTKQLQSSALPIELSAVEPHMAISVGDNEMAFFTHSLTSSTKYKFNEVQFVLFQDALYILNFV